LDRFLNTVQNINAKAICSDGDWLKGESNAFKKEKGSCKMRLDTSGFAYENCNGNAIKNIPATKVTNSMRHVNILS